MSEIDISQVINQMRVMASKAQAQPVNTAPASQGLDFSSILKQSVDSVNSTQKHAGKMSEAFQAGDPNTNIAEVMVAMQKASVSFEAMKQVRSKLIDAYKEIMRMQV